MNDETGEFVSRVGPLTPYQRPLVILLFLVIPLGVLVVGASYLLTGELFVFRWKENKYSPPEVRFKTTAIASSANELLMAFDEKRLEFDRIASEGFGLYHEWHDPKYGTPPEVIMKYYDLTRDGKFLERYNRIVLLRHQLMTKMETLRSKVDGTVTGLGDGSRVDSQFRAERLTTEIREANEKLEVLTKQLIEAVTIFNMNDETGQFVSRVGPLAPYQRPLMILFFLILPLGVFVVGASYLLTGEFFFFRWMENKYSPPRSSCQHHSNR